jgi:hypothetical protein
MSDKVKFIISHSGDGSVGIPGEQAEVVLDASGFNAADRSAYVEGAREQLKKAFGAIWEFNPKVQTEAEVRAEWLGDEGVPRSPDYMQVIAQADRMLRAAGLPGYDEMIGALAQAKPYLENSVRASEAAGYQHARAYSADKLAMVQQCLLKHRDAEARAGHALSADGGEPGELSSESVAEQDVRGFVLAFPGGSDAEAEELVAMLKNGGNPVVHVVGDASMPALRASLVQASLDASDFTP